MLMKQKRLYFQPSAFWKRVTQLKMKIYFVLILLFLLATPNLAFAHPGEMNGTVTHIVDGDTFDITAVNSTKYRIRMADVNANELGQVGYAEAKTALASKIDGKTVYLDVDDQYIWDNRGTGDRVVAISYVSHNSTHYLNVNEAMFLGGYVEKKDYPNEFNPYTWKLYETKDQGIPEFPQSLLFILTLAVAIAGALFYMKKLRRKSLKS